jgi:hypothetical protein
MDTGKGTGKSTGKGSEGVQGGSMVTLVFVDV